MNEKEPTINELLEKVDRVEVIEQEGRKYVKWSCKPQFLVQDGGRTLKIMVENKKELGESGGIKDTKI